MKGIIAELIDKKLPLITNLSNVSAAINMNLDNINWCGFYIMQDDKLYLGPFQGEVACTVIELGKGVCGTSAKLQKTLIVDDVNTFKGHIACSAKSKSEIVVPIIKDNKTVAVIDIDAPIYNRFNKEIANELEKIADILKDLF